MKIEVEKDAELGRIAMRFVDRAGDVHPGIDDAETICAEFHAAMSEAVQRLFGQGMRGSRAAPPGTVRTPKAPVR